MGGEAAKERRRLKRLEAAAQQKNDTAESAPAEVKKTDAKGKGQGNIAQVRLQRKIARKAQGTFKPLEGQAPPPIRKRKPESSNRTPVKKFKGGDNHASSKKSNVRKNNFEAKKSNVGKDAAAKKTKPKKPKHLKRKMEQLTKAISGGVSGEGEESTVSQLEQQMQKLAKQMEEFKKIRDKVTKNDTNQAAAERDQSEKISSTMESTEISTEETAPPATDDEAKQSKKTPKKDDKRRCIGRKPVTDFEVNKCYSGKVQYIKPRLGASLTLDCRRSVECRG
ncbi:hypothetical protein QTG54_000949 [Skeletonema marinoi]|uniref:Uncharacterized protein n=1 Tax=Skeletonema marinoi TaxID=267567 RepID=A0AAD9DKE1_9STRA|nr:hypothetical protein QTG54_000949 [Skeletonema marinoi]